MKPAMSCSTLISCLAAAAGSSYLAQPRSAIRVITDQIRRVGISSNILRLWYAQSHPDEDFAETFAVWLRPRSNWRARYAGWPALKKLEYVDELMVEIATQRPLLTHGELVDPLSRLTETLAAHYKKKQAIYAFDTPKTYDRDLLRLFSANPRHHRSEAASLFIRRNRGKSTGTRCEVDG